MGMDRQTMMTRATSSFWRVVGTQPLPIQAVDADGDHVIVDLDALPMGRHVLHLSVVHDGLASDELAVSVLDRRLAAP